MFAHGRGGRYRTVIDAGEHDDLERVRTYLRAQSVDDLVERVVNLAQILDEAWMGLVSEARIVTGDLDIAHPSGASRALKSNRQLHTTDARLLVRLAPPRALGMGGTGLEDPNPGR